MLTAAKIKEMEMILRATTPMDKSSADGSKKPMSCVGKIWKMRKPRPIKIRATL